VWIYNLTCRKEVGHDGRGDVVRDRDREIVQNIDGEIETYDSVGIFGRTTILLPILKHFPYLGTTSIVTTEGGLEQEQEREGEIGEELCRQSLCAGGVGVRIVR
jgi:hypothetical protein